MSNDTIKRYKEIVKDIFKIRLNLTLDSTEKSDDVERNHRRVINNMVGEQINHQENLLLARAVELFLFLKIICLSWWQKGKEEKSNVQFFDIYNQGYHIRGIELWPKAQKIRSVARVYKRVGMAYYLEKNTSSRTLAQDYRRIMDLQWQNSFLNWQYLEEEAATTLREFVEGWDTSVKIS